MDLKENVENMIWTKEVKDHYQKLSVFAYFGFATRNLSSYTTLALLSLNKNSGSCNL
jgi:hypothetical protein